MLRRGDQYVTILPMVVVVKRLHDALHLMFASVQNCPVAAALVGDMFHDFMTHWGDDIMYSCNVVCGALNWQVGIPIYAYWAALLEPRMNWSTIQVLTESEEEANMGKY
jgi:hypothetical protein